MADEQTKAVNRRARHEFTIDETFEAGIVLTGTEIKSIRNGKVNLADAYARIEKDEAWLIGAHIAPFEQGNRNNHEPKRARKLLLHRSEIDELLGRTMASSCTTGAGISPIATPGATSPASWPTRNGVAEGSGRG